MIFLWNRLELCWNRTEDIQFDQFRPVCQTKNVLNMALRGQTLANKAENIIWPHKSAQRAYFRLEKGPTWCARMPPVAYYPVVPAVVGTTSNSDMTVFEASGGCRGKGGWVVFVIFVYASVIYCNVYIAQPHKFNRPCVAGAVLQTALLLIDWLIESSFPPNLQNTINSKPKRLGSWNFERMIIPHQVSGVRCQVSGVRCQGWC